MTSAAPVNAYSTMRRYSFRSSRRPDTTSTNWESGRRPCRWQYSLNLISWVSRELCCSPAWPGWIPAGSLRPFGLLMRYSIGPRTVDVYAIVSTSVRRGRWFESTHADYCLTYYRHTYGSSSDNFAISFALTKLSIGNGPLPAQVTADHSGQLVFLRTIISNSRPSRSLATTRCMKSVKTGPL